MGTHRPARNGPCPCGSGRKYRKCCGLAATTAPFKAGVSSDLETARREGADRPGWRSRALAMGGVAALAVVLYAGLFSAPFVYDDLVYVRDNAFVRDAANLLAFWSTPYPADRPELGLYRPVTATSYLADFSLWGADAGGFHVTNAVLHGLASALCVAVVLSFGAALPAATVTGVLFAAHPVHTEAVAWVVGRAEVLAALGCLGACLAWVRFRRTGRGWSLGLALLLYFLALGAKETAAPLPAALLLAEWLGVSRGIDAPPMTASPGRRLSRWISPKAMIVTSEASSRATLGDVPPRGAGPESTAPRAASEAALGRRHRARRFEAQLRWLPYAGFAVVFAVYAALRVEAVGQFGMLRDTMAFAGEPTRVRLLSAVAIIGHYARLCVLPTSLRVDYSDLRYDSVASGPVLIGLAVIAVVVGGGWLVRRRLPQLALWGWWFLLFVLVFSNLILPIGAVAAERFVYIASLGPCALAGLAIARGLRPALPAAWRVTTAAAALAAIVASAAGTLARAADWRDPIQLFRVEAERSPRSEKARMNLGLALGTRGKATGNRALLEEAGSVFRDGIALGSAVGHTMTGDHPRLLYHYATLLQESGRPADAVPLYARVAELHERYPILRKDMPVDYHVWYGAALEAVGKPDEARAQYELALARKPRWMVPLRNLAQIAWRQERREEAVSLYRRAIEADPSASSNYAALGVLLSELSRHEEAQAVLVALRQSAPSTAEALYYQGMLAQRLGRAGEAAADYRRAIEIDPQRADARQALAALGNDEGRP